MASFPKSENLDGVPFLIGEENNESIPEKP